MKTVLIDSQPEETRVAVVEDGSLQALEVERSYQSTLVGNIYKGRIQNILPGMQAAFVDIGAGKNAFLYIGDGSIPSGLVHMAANGKFHIGQNIMLQIEKDAVGTKGPKATLQFSLPGRFLVLMPYASYIGISRRIKDDGERQRLKDIVFGILPPDMGLIIRTAAQDQLAELLRDDARQLLKLWQAISAQYDIMSAPALIYRDADMVIRTVRDVLDDDTASIVVNDRSVYLRVAGLLSQIDSAHTHELKLYESSVPLFDAYRLQDEMRKIYQREINLPSGGAIVIDHTEAMTVIDVNSGKFVGNGNQLTDTVYQVNREAAHEILRQLHLRDIGGIVIVDFIDMDEEAQRVELLQYLRGLAARDRVRTVVIDMTPLGLVEITRKKARRNFSRTSFAACPYCEGNGYVEAPITVAIQICREIRQIEKRSHAPFGYEVSVHDSALPEIAKCGILTELGKNLHIAVKLHGTSAIHPSGYTISRLSDD